MKGKTATTGLLAMGIVILLATLGLVYGNWSQTLSIGGTVTTSGLNAEFLIKNVEDSEPAGSKDVGTCTAELERDEETGKAKGVEIIIDNAYPNYECSIEGAIQNTGQMPINIVAKQVVVLNADGTSLTQDIGVKVSERPCGDAEKQLMPDTAGLGDGETLQCTIVIQFLNKNAAGESLLPEKASFTFDWGINICQFDKPC